MGLILAFWVMGLILAFCISKNKAEDVYKPYDLFSNPDTLFTMPCKNFKITIV